MIEIVYEETLTSTDCGTTRCKRCDKFGVLLTNGLCPRCDDAEYGTKEE